MIRADFHIHTTFSDDSQTTPKDLVERLVSHPSIKVAAVTDHDSVKGIESVRNLARPYPDILILPGVEISTLEGDVVVLGTEQLPPRPWTIHNVVGFAQRNGFVSIAAHPFREWGMGEEARDSGVDCIEVLNGGSTLQANRKARELAAEMKLPGVAGSDSHKPSELFSVYNEVEAGLDIEEILEALRIGLVKPVSATDSICF